MIGYTSAVNTPSRHAIVKAGMTEMTGAAFEDETVPVGHPLRPHVLYRIGRRPDREVRETTPCPSRRARHPR